MSNGGGDVYLCIEYFSAMALSVASARLASRPASFIRVLIKSFSLLLELSWLRNV